MPTSSFRLQLGSALLGSALILSGCLLGSRPNEKQAASHALGNNGLLSVTVSQDGLSGVMTLRGIVGERSLKTQAGSLVKQAAHGCTISDQIRS